MQQDATRQANPPSSDARALREPPTPAQARHYAGQLDKLAAGRTGLSQKDYRQLAAEIWEALNRRGVTTREQLDAIARGELGL